MTGMDAVAMSPRAGAHGEACGMMAIKAAITAKGEDEARKTVLVPESAHGTNPASAAGAGFEVRPVPARPDGTLDPAEVKNRLGADVAAIMLTNPNTCGLFEKDAAEIAALVHEAGAYFYCDGANFNAIMGKARPGDLGVDAMHINLHKTFSTPHGGGGPGAGPVVLSSRLAPFAPVPFLRREEGGFRLVEHLGEAPGAFGRIAGLPWPDGHVRARLCLCAVAWRRRLAAGRRGRRAECELYPREPQGSDVRTVRRPALHARGFVRRDMAEAHWPHNARFRQGDDRRRLSPHDDLFPPRGARRDADRADRIGIESLARSFHRGLARSRAGRKARGNRPLCGRA